MAAETLRVVEGLAVGVEIPLEETLEIGREVDGDSPLAADPELSRRHARFSRAGDGSIVLEDLGSTNGTYVNGERITAPRVLAAGDRIKVGETVLELALPAAEPPAPITLVEAAPVPRTEAAARQPLAGTQTIKLGLEGKHAVVTGASGAIGRACAEALALQGVAVAAVLPAPAGKARELADDLQAAANGSYVTELDAAAEPDVERLVSAAVSRFGSIDILVSCPGSSSAAPVSDFDVGAWRHVLDADVTGTFLLLRHVLETMDAGGTIVTVCSPGTASSLDERLLDAAAAGGVAGLTATLGETLKQRGIRANHVVAAPADASSRGGDDGEEAAALEELTGLQRQRQADEIASVVLFLASDLSRFVSGQTLTIQAAT